MLIRVSCEQRCKLEKVTRYNQGVALLSVLIVVALVSATAAWLIRNQHIAVTRTTQIINQERSMLHALSIEFLALELLQEDKDRAADYYTTRYPTTTRRYEDGYLRPVDTNQELWSRKWDVNSRNFEEFDDVSMFKNVSWSICMQDISGLADINMVHRSLNESVPKSQKKVMQQLFKNLFEHANLGPRDHPDTPKAEELMDVLLDWFDRGDSPRSYGAESSEYLIQQPAYLPAERRMIWPEEIYLLHRFTPKTVRDFVDYITALPYLVGKAEERPKRKININTAPYAILRALPGLDEENDPDGLMVSDIMLYRRDYYNKPFNRPEELCNKTSVGNLCVEESGVPFWSKGDYKKHLGVKSEFVIAAISVSSGDFNIELQSLILRGKNEPKVLQRRFGNGYYNRCQASKSGLIKGK